ncbi:TlpA family protein disulfide reductase [Euzebya tangerina]|uniref:TlpA family protein disulfide reductase n=1 Tax=Euzebya tangerina TaxID=591198 RepID=UPI000E315A1B|nr:TlpA disulfide reductase family protein [Euzebya tangerina]
MSSDLKNSDVDPTDGDNSKRARQKARRAERLAAEQAEAAKRGTKQTLLKVLGVIGAIALVGVLGFVLVQGSDPTLGIETATVDGDAAALPQVSAQGAADAAVGSPAPVVEGFDADGTPVTIGEPGQAQAVVFLAHWCPHCQEEVPLITQWAADGVIPDDVQLVGVSTLQDPARSNWPPDEWLAGEDFPGPVIYDGDETTAESWGLSGTPMWAFTNADGQIVARYSGQIDQATFEQGLALASDAAPA